MMQNHKDAYATAFALAGVLSTEAVRALAVATLVRLAQEAATITELAQAIAECRQETLIAKRNAREASRYENS